MGEVGGGLVGGRKFINLPHTHHPSFVRRKTVKSKTLLDKDYAAVKYVSACCKCTACNLFASVRGYVACFFVCLLICMTVRYVCCCSLKLDMVNGASESLRIGYVHTAASPAPFF